MIRYTTKKEGNEAKTVFMISSDTMPEDAYKEFLSSIGAFAALNAAAMKAYGIKDASTQMVLSKIAEDVGKMAEVRTDLITE